MARGCCMHVFLVHLVISHESAYKHVEICCIIPGARVPIPLGYLHPGKSEHSKVQSHPLLCNGRSTFDDFRRYTHARVQTVCGLVSIRLVIGQEKQFVLLISRQK